MRINKFLVLLFVSVLFQLTQGDDMENHVPPPLLDEDTARRIASEFDFFKRSVPGPDDVELMRAEINSGLQRDIAPFDVPKSFYKGLLSKFSGYSVDQRPDYGLYEMGSILIKTKDRKVHRLSWYVGTEGPLSFSLQGCRFKVKDHGQRGDQSFGVDALVRKAHEAYLKSNIGKE